MSRWMDEVKRLHPENAVALLGSGICTAIIAGHPNYPTKYLRISLAFLSVVVSLLNRLLGPSQAFRLISWAWMGMARYVMGLSPTWRCSKRSYGSPKA
jgi:hypothetical protein